MVEIAELLEGKISRIDLVILNTRQGFEGRNEGVFHLTFPLGKPSSFKISNIRFSVRPDANVLLILKSTHINPLLAREVSPTFEQESSY